MPKQPSPLGKDYNPGAARWCDVHGRLECTKNRTKGRGPCHKAAIRGHDSCDIHAGRKKAIVKAEGEARITAWKPTGKQIGVDAGMAVIGVLQMTWLRLAAYAELLRQQVMADQGLHEVPEGAEMIATTEGLIGFRYGMGGKEGILYQQSEEARALVALEAAERDRVVKYAKTAHDMGISERITNLAEKWGDLVAGRIAAMLDDLDLSPEQAVRVPSLLQAHLGSIEVDAIGKSGS